MSTIFRMGLLCSHIKSLANSLLNTIFSLVIDARKQNGGIEYSEHLSPFSEMFTINSELFHLFALMCSFE